MIQNQQQKFDASDIYTPHTTMLKTWLSIIWRLTLKTCCNINKSLQISPNKTSTQETKKCYPKKINKVDDKCLKKYIYISLTKKHLTLHIPLNFFLHFNIIRIALQLQVAQFYHEAIRFMNYYKKDDNMHRVDPKNA